LLKDSCGPRHWVMGGVDRMLDVPRVGMCAVIDNDIDIFVNCNWVLTPGGISTAHIYTQTIHKTTQLTNFMFMGPCIVNDCQ